MTTSTGLSHHHDSRCLVESGDHVLMTDSAYGPTRTFCTTLARMGIETLYDPGVGGESLNSSAQYGTGLHRGARLSSFEMQMPATAAVARERNAAVMDNTRATPHFRPLEHGVDVSLRGVLNTSRAMVIW